MTVTSFEIATEKHLDFIFVILTSLFRLRLPRTWGTGCASDAARATVMIAFCSRTVNAKLFFNDLKAKRVDLLS